MCVCMVCTHMHELPELVKLVYSHHHINSATIAKIEIVDVYI